MDSSVVDLAAHRDARAERTADLYRAAARSARAAADALDAGHTSLAAVELVAAAAQLDAAIRADIG